ncbi:MAG: molybdenum cofactor biosynthesis protein MoaE [Gammaproteobacteria bacterium]|nr:molybdenum cofactor biosynthesis protein MoaE [Gammaproteobacteria bacterium]NNM14390.1 molybdenum cofactor biosynthesis protein MoaE [Gammaproteobacteria bacterium]
MFTLTEQPIERTALIKQCKDVQCGGFVSFEGWVRDHNHGQKVSHLVYEAYPELAIKEGQCVIAEALEKFAIQKAHCVHRTGHLDLQDIAVWVGVSAAHRDAAYQASQYIIDEIKARVPIWKKEFYQDGQISWVNCPRCQQAHA